jgi:hypothetical protein
MLRGVIDEPAGDRPGVKAVFETLGHSGEIGFDAGFLMGNKIETGALIIAKSPRSGGPRPDRAADRRLARVSPSKGQSIQDG